MYPQVGGFESAGTNSTMPEPHCDYHGIDTRRYFKSRSLITDTQLEVYSKSFLTVCGEDYGYDQGTAAGCHAFFYPGLLCGSDAVERPYDIMRYNIMHAYIRIRAIAFMATILTRNLRYQLRFGTETLKTNEGRSLLHSFIPGPIGIGYRGMRMRLVLIKIPVALYALHVEFSSCMTMFG